MRLPALEIDMFRQSCLLLAQYIKGHHTAERVSNQMYSTRFLKAWIVSTPQAIHSICLFDNCFNHLFLVMRKIVWNVQHDIADEIPYSRNRLGRDVLQIELIL